MTVKVESVTTVPEALSKVIDRDVTTLDVVRCRDREVIAEPRVLVREPTRLLLRVVRDDDTVSPVDEEVDVCWKGVSDDVSDELSVATKVDVSNSSGNVTETGETGTGRRASAEEAAVVRLREVSEPEDTVGVVVKAWLSVAGKEFPSPTGRPNRTVEILELCSFRTACDDSEEASLRLGARTDDTP